MIIKKLVLKSFGKFQNTTIEFKEGLNLILGENESGKSTIHQFIEGMFYGFYKPNIKNKKISDLYEKYFPWDNATDYSGVMIIEDGKELRIERNFMKNKDALQVFDNVTGENITEAYPYDAVTRMYQPAIKHLGLNLAAYQNTISITQMKSKTTEDLIAEIKDNVINLGDTKRVDISVNNILRILAEKKATIGTERSKKSDYGMTKETIEIMETEKEDTQKNWEEIKELKQQENNQAQNLETLEQQKLLIEKKMAFVKRQDNEENYQKVKQLKEEADALKQKLTEYEAFKGITKEDINEVYIKMNNRGFYDTTLKEEQEKIEEMIKRKTIIENEIAQIDSIIIEIGASEKISRDIYKYEEFENGRKYAEQGVEPQRTEQLKEAIRKKKGKRNGAKGLTVMFTCLTLFLGLLKAFELFGDPLTKIFPAMVETLKTFQGISGLTLIGLLGLFAITLLLWTRYKTINIQWEALERELKLAIESENAAEIRKKDTEERQAVLLSKHGCESYDELIKLRDTRVNEELLYQENFMKARQLEEEKEYLEEQIHQGNDKHMQRKALMEEVEKTISAYMKRFGVYQEEALKESLNAFEVYKSLEQELQNKEYILLEMTKGRADLLEAQQVDTLGENLPLEDDDSLTVLPNENYETFEKALRDINEKIVLANKALSGITAAIAGKEHKIKRPAQIEEALNTSYEKLDRLNFKLNTYTIIEEAIRQISRNIQDNFAPILNERLSKIISIATDYKYTDVKVSSEMEITIVDNELNKLVRADDLSAGTVDLMYFALRLSIAEIINNSQSVPIILDDSFVQYDERRLVKMLELLSKLDRQILLFTCHKREAKVIKRIVEDLNVVNL